MQVSQPRSEGAVNESTADGADDWLREHAQAAPVPGLVLLVQAGEPAVGTIALTRAASGVKIGRGVPHGMLAEDAQVSREHVQVSVQGEDFCIRDLGSRNGTYLDGVRLMGEIERKAPALLRIGRSLLWLVADVRPFTEQPRQPRPSGQGPVLGGLSRRALGEIAIASKAGDTLLIAGESGAGKEGMARAFHEAHFGPDTHTHTRAPFIAVNCAAIPEGLAERLLFGAKRGAFSGATDADGYIVDAHGGTLFLDEIAELDPLVQAKLLRVFETREVVALGTTQARKVQIRICAATHKDLRDEISHGRFRADLYYRIGRPTVRIPPLRERLDELPWLLARACTSVDAKLRMPATTVEHLALRPWPGNVRELLQEARRAAHAALHEGSDFVRSENFAPEAGLAFAPVSTPGGSTAPDARDAESAPARTTNELDDAVIEAALDEHGGNVTRAAKVLGLHRNQLRRWVAKRAGHAATEPPDDAND